MHILGLCGSLREHSYNRLLLTAAARELPDDAVFLVFEDIDKIPPYNEDIDTRETPVAVQALRAAIAAASGILITTPEYNASVPGLLKNAIDWASRPPEQPFDGKPITILGASPGALGSARAQYHLRQCFIYLNGQVMNRPEVMIGAANSKFDAEGNLTDQRTADFLKGFLAAFADHIRYHQRARSVS